MQQSHQSLEHRIQPQKVLLNDISGEAHDGEIMAVLGASGSGKSTLTDALANRITKGTMNLNGEPLESRLLKVISAYVMQDDLLFPISASDNQKVFLPTKWLPLAKHYFDNDGNRGLFLITSSLLTRIEFEKTRYNSSMFIDVQNPPSEISLTSAPTSSPIAKRKHWLGTILGSTFGICDALGTPLSPSILSGPR
ncbi:hypothetical protein LguiB_002044 [Lonicera macranthoides]